jgi:predicted Rdx family selenoprotein
LAAAIKEATAVEAVLEVGADGIFDVEADGELIFSRAAQEGRFPEADEIIATLVD